MNEGRQYPDTSRPGETPTEEDAGRDGMRLAGRFSVDMDIGGTFTDLIVSRKGYTKLFKVDTTPHDLCVCFRAAMDRAVKELGYDRLEAFLAQVRVVRLSTSLSTNILLERKGVRIGLLLEKGWNRILLGQSTFPQGQGSPVEPDMVVEIGDGDQSGRMLRPVVDEIRNAAFALIREGAEVLVISLEGPRGFYHEEKRAQDVIRRFYANHFIGSIPVVTAGQLTRSPDFAARTNRILFNTYAHGAVAEPFLEIEEYLRSHGYAYPLLLVHSDGGSSRVSKTAAEQTISSGASAGIFGARRLTTQCGLENAVTVDIGGTSTEIGVIRQGRIATPEANSGDGASVIGGLPMAATLGLGGGSIIRVNDEGWVRIGPDSVGAFPGPACYGLGGDEATLTDAFLILGYFDEDYFLGGARRLNRGSAESVFQRRIAGPLGTSLIEAAWLVKLEAVHGIAGEIGRRAEGLGLGLPDTDLFAVGGCGGCMGEDIRRAAGLRKLHFFRQGSVFGAFGSSGMDVVHRYELNLDFPLSAPGRRIEETCETVNAAVLGLQHKAFQDMAAEGFSPEGVQFELQLGLESGRTAVRKKYDSASTFLWPGEWAGLRKKVLKLFKEEDPGIRADRIIVREILLFAVAPIPHADTDVAITFSSNRRKAGRRIIYSGSGGWVEARVHNWDSAEAPMRVNGPCILEGHDTTVIVSAGSEMVMDKRKNVVVQGAGEQP